MAVGLTSETIFLRRKIATVFRGLTAGFPVPVGTVVLQSPGRDTLLPDPFSDGEALSGSRPGRELCAKPGVFLPMFWEYVNFA